MKKVLLLSIMALIVAKLSLAQDPHFSQIQYNPLYLNPANAGVTEYGKLNRVAGIYRDQWRVLPVPYSTTNASYDRLFKKWKKGWMLGGGLSFLYDRAGDGHLSIFNPNITMNVGKYFNKDKQLITLGVTAGVTIKSLDYLGLTWDNQYNGTSFDGTLPTGETFSNNNVSFANFTIGLGFRTKIKGESTLDIGGTASNLHQPQQNFLYFTKSKMPARYTAYAKAKAFIGKKGMWNLQPGFFYERQKKFNKMLVNAIAEVRFGDKKDVGIGIGAGYRINDNDAPIAYVSFLYKTLRIGGAYDINTSAFKKATKSQGAFEVVLNYEWGTPKKPKIDTIKIQKNCPEYAPVDVTVLVKQKGKDTLLGTFNKSFEPDTVPQKYIDSMEIAIPEKIIANNPDLFRTTPIELFFDNDIPKINVATDYQQLYSSYKSRIDEFKSKSADDDAKVQAFFDYIDKNYGRLDRVVGDIIKLINYGYSVEIEFRGYTSPLASEAYNKSLSERRIASIMALFKGKLGDNVDKLTFRMMPFGKSLAPANISQSRKEPAKSVFGIDASKERKVEILGFRIEKPE
ncbi:MAG: PorP/SprF family type IX secretion system membrane protein [Chitinophagales bacterium]